MQLDFTYRDILYPKQCLNCFFGGVFGLVFFLLVCMFAFGVFLLFLFGFIFGTLFFVDNHFSLWIWVCLHHVTVENIFVTISSHKQASSRQWKKKHAFKKSTISTLNNMSFKRNKIILSKHGIWSCRELEQHSQVFAWSLKSK